MPMILGMGMNRVTLISWFIWMINWNFKPVTKFHADLCHIWTYAKFSMAKCKTKKNYQCFSVLKMSSFTVLPTWIDTTIEVLTSFAGLMAIEWWSVRKLGYYPFNHMNEPLLRVYDCNSDWAPSLHEILHRTGYICSTCIYCTFTPDNTTQNLAR